MKQSPQIGVRVLVASGAFKDRKGRVVDPPLAVRNSFSKEDAEATIAELQQRQEEYFLTKYGQGCWVDLYQEGDPETADLFGRETNVRGAYIRYFALGELELL